MHGGFRRGEMALVQGAALRYALLFFFFLSKVSSLEIKPWLNNAYEFCLDVDYSYSRYAKVQNAHPQLHHPSNDQLLNFDLGFVPSPTWSCDLDVEFVNTPRQKWGFRSGAAQLRMLWLDDIEGDPISLTTGVDARVVSQRSLEDVSTPYHGNWNFALSTAVGKEWAEGEFWRYRTFGFLSLGIATRGYPWLFMHYAFLANIEDRHRWELFADGYFGFGNQSSIDPNDFNGYADIAHRSVDIGAAYAYHFPAWGTLSFCYDFRLFARSFPEYVSFFTIQYQLPFSPF